MKHTLLIVCIILIGIILISAIPTQQNAEYLRIHIRANSNLTIDQTVKYEIKDEIVDYLIPHLANCKTKEESITVVTSQLNNISNLASQILKENGFSYTASAFIKEENFPTRTYGDLTLESGFYDALIVNLGSGSGDNWWCVVYPPLCFVNGSSKVNAFKSRILEIINQFF